ncbi:MAG TPA: DNA methyltransferase [Verrucomicrobiae bacterium]
MLRAQNPSDCGCRRIFLGYYAFELTPDPLELASRLVQMFSFTGDTVLDPFRGTGTTMVASLKHRRNSIGVELDTKYCKMVASKLMNENTLLFKNSQVQIECEATCPSHTMTRYLRRSAPSKSTSRTSSLYAEARRARSLSAPVFPCLAPKRQT